MKCIFSAPADAVCANCHRRGAKCVTQELPEEISDPLSRSLQLGDRVIRVERLVEQLLKKAEETDLGQHIQSLPTPASVEFRATNAVGLSEHIKVCMCA
jgi:hypothetical protein